MYEVLAFLLLQLPLSPIVSLLNPGGDAAWYLWVPGLAQNTLMKLVLKGEALTLARVLPGVLVGAIAR